MLLSMLEYYFSNTPDCASILFSGKEFKENSNPTRFASSVLTNMLLLANDLSENTFEPNISNKIN